MERDAMDQYTRDQVYDVRPVKVERDEMTCQVRIDSIISTSRLAQPRIPGFRLGCIPKLWMNDQMNGMKEWIEYELIDE